MTAPLLYGRNAGHVPCPLCSVALIPLIRVFGARILFHATPQTTSDSATSEPKCDRGVSRVGRARHETKRFELLVDELSAAMALAPADAVDREVDSWLGKICEALDLDRSAIYERDAQDQPVRTTHTWLRPGFPPFPRTMIRRSSSRWAPNWS